MRDSSELDELELRASTTLATMASLATSDATESRWGGANTKTIPH